MRNRGPLLSSALLILAALGVISPATAQVMVSYDLAAEPTPLAILTVRPNVTQPVYFHYLNPGPGIKRNVRVTLEQATPGGRFKTIGTATEEMVPAKKPALLKFAGVAEPKGDAPWPTLEGPPFALRFTVEVGTDKTETVVPVEILEPRKYIKVANPTYDPTRKRVSIKVKSDDPLDPPCPVELTMSPAAIPGLIPSKAGTFKQSLDKENQQVELIADNIRFEGDVPPEYGRFFLSVDGYERAFLYKCTFAEGTVRQLADEARARIVAPRFSAPSPKLPVVVEIDPRSLILNEDEDPQRVKVELRFDRVGEGNYENALGSPFRGARQMKIGYKADGSAILFQTVSKDWVVPLNTEGINGKRSLQVRVLDAKGNAIKLADEQDSRDEKVALFTPGKAPRFAPLTFSKVDAAVIGDLIIDGTPPEGMKIVNLPVKIGPEAKFVPHLILKDRSVTQAPVTKVVFFFGEAAKDDKIPETIQTVDAEYDAKSRRWIAKEEMIIPDGVKKVNLSVQASTATGILGGGKLPLVVRVPGKGDDGSDVLATITGRVVIGSLPQPGLTVTLKKAKAEKGTKEDEPVLAKTNAEGAFEFNEVAPGNYVISASRLGRFANVPLTVPKGKEKVDGGTLKLFLK